MGWGSKYFPQGMQVEEGGKEARLNYVDTLIYMYLCQKGRWPLKLLTEKKEKGQINKFTIDLI